MVLLGVNLGHQSRRSTRSMCLLSIKGALVQDNLLHKKGGAVRLPSRLKSTMLWILTPLTKLTMRMLGASATFIREFLDAGGSN